MLREEQYPVEDATVLNLRRAVSALESGTYADKQFVRSGAACIITAKGSV